MAVHPYIIERGDTFTTENHPTVFPSGRHSESSSVRANFVFFRRYERRILLEVEHLIIEFISLVHINSSSISLTLPVSGYVNVCPPSGIERRFIKVFRTEVGILHPMELPFAVQAQIIGRLFIVPFFHIGSICVRPHIGVRGQLVQAYRILALPFGSLLRLCGHHNQTGQ